MKRIKLTRGKYAIVDDEDYPLVRRFVWRAEPNRNTFYAITTIPRAGGGRQSLRMHQLILGIDPDKTIDHRNRNGLDNRRKNLRHATGSEQQRNTRRATQAA